MPKNAKKFECKKCNFTCSKESNWNIHINTLKHKRKQMEIPIVPKNAKKCQTYTCSHCEKEFKSSSGVWKHQKKCLIAQAEKTQV